MDGQRSGAPCVRVFAARVVSEGVQVCVNPLTLVPPGFGAPIIPRIFFPLKFRFFCGLSAVGSPACGDDKMPHPDPERTRHETRTLERPPSPYPGRFPLSYR